jgi:hypothetical protein
VKRERYAPIRSGAATFDYQKRPIGEVRNAFSSLADEQLRPPRKSRLSHNNELGPSRYGFAHDGRERVPCGYRWKHRIAGVAAVTDWLSDSHPLTQRSGSAD